VPADDPRFLRINNAQWVWYSAQIAQDEDEEFELLRDMAEHNAMFWNQEGVNQVRQARKRTYKLSDSEFGTMLESTFGRKLNVPDESSRIPLAVPAEKSAPSSGGWKMRDDVDAGAYLGMELDDISFTPFKE